MPAGHGVAQIVEVVYGVGEGVGAGPADIVENLRGKGHASGTDQPVAAIICRAEDNIITAQQPECTIYVAAGDCRDVRADYYYRA